MFIMSIIRFTLKVELVFVCLHFGSALWDFGSFVLNSDEHTTSEQPCTTAGVAYASYASGGYAAQDSDDG